MIPPPSSATVADVSIEVDYELVLNVLATGLFAALYWHHRSSPSESVDEQPTHAGTTD